MGSYATCWLDDFSIGSSKNEVDPNLINLFRPSDKVVITDAGHEIPKKLEHWLEDRDEDDEVVIVYYATSAQVLKDRLELFGYTLDAAKRAFSASCVARVEHLKDVFEGHSIDAFQDEIRIINELTPERWMSELGEIRALGLIKDSRADRRTLRGFMLSEEWYGYPGVDLNVMLRLSVEAAFDVSNFVYDVTDLVLSGYYDVEDDLVDWGISDSADDFSHKSKIIVLTEGKTDSLVLSETMRVLYPHLSDYYSFMDFDGSRAVGGVGSLVSLVKAFAGAGIVNRTIALFDNDTAACSAMLALNSVALPPHIVVQRLPEIDLLECYPTIGPTGPVSANVNGVASSIELMFGADVLKNDEYGFTPVQWTGYEARLKRYQGEVIGKQSLHEKYKVKLDRARQGVDLDSMDWTGMRAVFRQLFCAFHEVDSDKIVELSANFS